MTLNYCMGTDNFTPLIIHVDLVTATVFMTESYFILSGNLLKMLNQTQGTREAAKTMFSHPETHMFSSCFHALPASEKKRKRQPNPKNLVLKLLDFSSLCGLEELSIVLLLPHRHHRALSRHLRHEAETLREKGSPLADGFLLSKVKL